jgi:hypothetical protein
MGGRVSLLLKEPKEQAWWMPLWRAYETRVQLLAERDGDEVVVSKGGYCKTDDAKDRQSIWLA